MATFPGLKTIDPIQGLVSYVQDIKPYHSKIFEVLVEYTYQDFVNVTIVDTLNLDIGLRFQEPIPLGIVTLGTVTSGLEYTNGTYLNVPLTGGSGTGATATIVVSGSIVTSVTLIAQGTGYQAGDILSALNTNIGGTGSGFTVLVATVGIPTGQYWYNLTTNTLYIRQNNVWTVVATPVTVSTTAPIPPVVPNPFTGPPPIAYWYNPSTGTFYTSVNGHWQQTSALISTTDPSSSLVTVNEGILTGGPIVALGALIGGSGYTDGTYTNVPLVGGTGSGAQATIVVLHGVVTTVTLTAAGVGYNVGDLLIALPAVIGPLGSGFLVPVNSISLSLASKITEMFDFFITAPTPFVASIINADPANAYVYLAGPNLTSTGTNQVPVGSLIVISGVNYDVIQAVYDPANNWNVITLKTPTTVTGGIATVYNIDTSYSFSLPVLSFNTGVTITEPVTGTTFTGSTFEVAGNVSTAIQPGSVFKIQETNATYYTEYVHFVPAFAIDGAREPTLDTTIIGVSASNPAFSSIPTAGTIIPYRTTGYDNPYDGVYDQMAGYQINYPAQ